MRRIDTHAHVFTTDLPMASGARYRPGADARLGDYLAVLDRHGIEGGVLVQPSFLGADNRYLLESLDASRDRLRGIVVLAPDTAEDDLAEMAARGVVGVRLNLVGLPTDALEATWSKAFARRVAHLGWQVEVHVEGARLARVLPALADFEGPIVVDHLGRPTPGRGLDGEVFRTLRAVADDPRVHVKLSAPYRLGGLDPIAGARVLSDALGPDRLVWGSDWPWTQHEVGRDYAALMPGAFGLDRATEAIIHRTASRLFRFDLADEKTPADGEPSSRGE